MADCRCFKGGVSGNRRSWHDAFSSHTRHSIDIFSYHKKVAFPSSLKSLRYDQPRIMPMDRSEGLNLHSAHNSFAWRGGHLYHLGNLSRGRFHITNVIDFASSADVINDLGFDTLTFLAVTVLVVPAFKLIKSSPILGFFCAGVVLNQFGLIRNLTDVKVLSEWGILFLLFEMELELSLARLKALAKFAFGMGLTQVVLCTLAFTAFELPPNGAIGTRILEFIFHSRSDLVNIRSVDEAVVIGAALSLSSSAFVLQLLAEKGELPTRFGSATLGILLLQDITVVPLLVILPVLENQTCILAPIHVLSSCLDMPFWCPFTFCESRERCQDGHGLLKRICSCIRRSKTTQQPATKSPHGTGTRWLKKSAEGGLRRRWSNVVSPSITSFPSQTREVMLKRIVTATMSRRMRVQMLRRRMSISIMKRRRLIPSLRRRTRTPMRVTIDSAPATNVMLVSLCVLGSYV